MCVYVLAAAQTFIIMFLDDVGVHGTTLLNMKFRDLVKIRSNKPVAKP